MDEDEALSEASSEEQKIMDEVVVEYPSRVGEIRDLLKNRAGTSKR